MSMMRKIYTSTLSTIWPEDRQLALIPLERDSTNWYRDLKITKPMRASRQRLLDGLVEREAMLNALRVNGDEIHVASLANLCVDRRDLLSLAARCARQGVTIIAYRGDVRITPESSAVALDEASDQLMKDRTGGATEKSRAAAAELKKQQTRDRLALVELDYKQRLMTIEQIRIKGGTQRGKKIAPMAHSTLLKAFGNRKKAQDAYEKEQFRLARVSEALTAKAEARRLKKALPRPAPDPRAAIVRGFLDRHGAALGDTEIAELLKEIDNAK